MGPEGQCEKVQREKHWAELTDAEKIERMRREVKRLIQTVDEQQAAFYRLQEHQHSGNGTLMVPLNSSRNELPRRYRDSDYF